jgi:hypothetical protein
MNRIVPLILALALFMEQMDATVTSLAPVGLSLGKGRFWNIFSWTRSPLAHSPPPRHLGLIVREEKWRTGGIAK